MLIYHLKYILLFLNLLLFDILQLNQKKQYLSELTDRFAQEMEKKLTGRRHRLQLCAGRLDGLSPLKKLQQGYSYTELSDHRPLRSIAQVRQGERLLIHVTDGKIEAQVQGTEAVQGRVPGPSVCTDTKS